MNFLYRATPSRPVTQLNLVFPSHGACLDPADRQGLTRFTLRQMLMGAGGMNNETLNGRLERLGASTGFHLANDHFTLRMVTLSENLQAALELFLLSLHQPLFDGAEFSQLQGELVSGWLSERDESKQTRAHEVYLHRIYGGGPQGYLSDGMVDGLRAISLEDVKRHYQGLFLGPKPIVAMLSNLTRGDLESQVLSRLTIPFSSSQPATNGGGGLASGGNGGASLPPFPWKAFSPPQRSGRRVTIVSDENTQTDEMMMGFFSTHPKDPDWHLHRLISLIFGGDMNSRLFRVVRGERGLSYGASCWYDANSGRVPRNLPAPFSIYSFPSVEHSAEAAPLLISLHETFVKEGATADELALAKSSLINSNPFRLDIPEKQISQEIQQALYGVTLDDETENQRKLEAVSLAQLREALAKTHRPEAFEMVLLGDPARLMPIAEKISNVEKIETIHYP